MSLSESVDALLGEAAAVWGFLIAAAIVLVLTPAVSWLAPRIGGMDVGGDRLRVHRGSVPRIGGIAIVAGIAVPAFALLDLSPAYTAVLIGALLVAALGLVDDIRGIPPAVKMAGLVAAALIPVAGYDVTFDHVTLPLIGDHDIGVAAYPLTVLWVVAIANLINLIDGMDALAGGIVAIASGSFAILAASFGRAQVAALAMMICGATLAFLRHNYHPARIFMGDTGALALGYLLACVSVQGVLKTAAATSLVAPLLVLAVPIFDTSFVVLKRLKYRRPPWDADHNHLYHRFMRIGLSQRRTAAYLHAWAALLAAYAILTRFLPPRSGDAWDLGNTLILAGAGLFIIAASVWMVYTLEIVKARHLRAIGLARRGPLDDEGALEHALTARSSEPTEVPDPEDRPDHVRASSPSIRGPSS